MRLLSGSVLAELTAQFWRGGPCERWPRGGRRRRCGGRQWRSAAARFVNADRDLPDGVPVLRCPSAASDADIVVVDKPFLGDHASGRPTSRRPRWCGCVANSYPSFRPGPPAGPAATRGVVVHHPTRGARRLPDDVRPRFGAQDYHGSRTRAPECQSAAPGPQSHRQAPGAITTVCEPGVPNAGTLVERIAATVRISLHRPPGAPAASTWRRWGYRSLVTRCTPT